MVVNQSEALVIMSTKKIIKISPRMLKLHLAKVGAFFETQCTLSNSGVHLKESGSGSFKVVENGTI